MSRVSVRTAGRLNEGRTAISVVSLMMVFSATSVRAEVVSEAVGKVSVERYKVYEVALENMGLGLYGGPQYNQMQRNRDGWASGGTLGNQEARLYLIDQFTLLGLAVWTQGVYQNVVAEWPGTVTPQEIYIICAHYDTTSGGERPGGDDDASGIAGVLEAARVLTQYHFRSTLRFIAFNAEEDWMKGSREYVDTLPADANIMGVINLDMILRPGWDSDPNAPLDLEVETLKAPSCIAWVEAFVHAAAAYVPSLIIDPNSHYPVRWDAGDHGPFIAAGYPALIASENTADEIWYRLSNRYYHSAEDASNALANDANSPARYDYNFAASVVKATVATLALRAVPVPPSDPNRSAGQALPNGARHFGKTGRI